jgi:hypothetical protein
MSKRRSTPPSQAPPARGEFLTGQAAAGQPRAYLYTRNSTHRTPPHDTAQRRSMSHSMHAASRTLGDNMGLVSAVIAVVVAQLLKPFSEAGAWVNVQVSS